MIQDHQNQFSLIDKAVELYCTQTILFSFIKIVPQRYSLIQEG